MSNQFDKDPLAGPELDPAWDQAIAARLGRLRKVPPGLDRLKASMRAELDEVLRKPQRRLWLAPVRATAASFVLLAVLVGLLVSSSGGPVMASAQQMAQVHEDLVSGRTPAARVDSIAAANRALAEQSSQAPDVPDVPHEHVMACCMKSVRGKRVACVLMDKAGTPVTLTIANAADMKLPASPIQVRAGNTYHVQSVSTGHGVLHMVMTERHGRWVCLIGQLPAERLMDIADQLQF